MVRPIWKKSSIEATRRRRLQVVAVGALIVLTTLTIFWDDPLVGTSLLLSSEEGAAGKQQSKAAQLQLALSAPCRREREKQTDLALHFLTASYDYQRTQLRQQEAKRDQDLQSLSIPNIFDNSGSAAAALSSSISTHRWPGVNLNAQRILEFAQRVVKPWKEEWNNFPNNKAQAKNPQVDYYRKNGMHEGSDPIILHSFVRTFQPRRVLEVESGFSSRVTVGALARNEKEQQQDGSSSNASCPPSSFTVIDPFMGRMARDANGQIIGPTDVHSSWVEQERLAFFAREYLQAGDLLFIDSSHALGHDNGKKVFFTDVMVEYAEVLPRLPPGVFCHVHDISFPDHDWFYERNWQEQFVLRAFMMNNPYFDVIWSGGALNMPWAHLQAENEEDKRAIEAKVQETRKTAVDAVGPHLHVFEVSKKRPFAGGSIWIRRNLKPYPGAESCDQFGSEDTLEQILKDPKRHLAGVGDTPASIQVQKDFLQINKDKHSKCLAQQGRQADCVVCSLLADLPGQAHVFDLDRLSSACSSVPDKKIEHHSRQEILTLPLSFFTSLQAGDTIILSKAGTMGNKRSSPELLASTLFVMEIAPRLASGVHVVLYDGLVRDVRDLVRDKRNESVGTFLTQAWLAMNDAVQVLWWQDSDVSQNWSGTTQSPNDHAVIVKVLD